MGKNYLGLEFLAFLLLLLVEFVELLELISLEDLLSQLLQLLGLLVTGNGAILPDGLELVLDILGQLLDEGEVGILEEFDSLLLRQLVQQLTSQSLLLVALVSFLVVLPNGFDLQNLRSDLCCHFSVGVITLYR